MCNSQFSFWEVRDEKFVRDDQFRAKSSQPKKWRLTTLSTLTCLRTYVCACGRTHVFSSGHDPAHHPGLSLHTLSLAPNCSPAVSYPTRLLYPARNHPPPRPPRFSPSPCPRSSRLSWAASQTQALTTGKVTASPSGRQWSDWHTGSFWRAQQQSWGEGRCVRGGAPPAAHLSQSPRSHTSPSPLRPTPLPVPYAPHLSQSLTPHTSPSPPPPAYFFSPYLTDPRALGQLHVHLGLEVLGVLEVGEV